MKKTDITLLNKELHTLIQMFSILKIDDKRRMYILNQIQTINKILKEDKPTKIEVSQTASQSPLQDFFNKHKNEKIGKKEPQRGKYNTI